MVANQFPGHSLEQQNDGLPLFGESGIECRKDGPTKVILTFNEPVQAIDGTPDANEVRIRKETIKRTHHRGAYKEDVRSRRVSRNQN